MMGGFAKFYTTAFVLQVYTNYFVSQNFSTIIFVERIKILFLNHFPGWLANFNGDLRERQRNSTTVRYGSCYSLKKTMKILIIPVIMLGIVFGSCAQTKQEPATTKSPNETIKTMQNNNLSTATFGGGCFWCTEAIFQQLKGVELVASGYSGGQVKNPSYREICNGTTGHAEAIQLLFDPTVISYEQLLQVFFTTHDPTTLNRQGADVGTQYRSVIFYHDENQKETAEKVKKEFAPTIWDGSIVTEVTPFSEFYKAEEYHQNYFNENSEQGYCRIVINPKVQKFRKQYADWLKE